MVIRMRHTRAHTANRRSHHGLTGPRMSECQKCKAVHVMHHACNVCGTYRGKVAIDVMKKVERTAKRATAKAGK